jgi:predicted DNA-binding transcriptional regulator AlpA
MARGRNAGIPSKYLTQAEAAVKLRMSVRTLSDLHRAGHGPPRRKMSPRKVIYPEAELDRWLAERELQEAAA